MTVALQVLKTLIEFAQPAQASRNSLWCTDYTTQTRSL